MKIPFPFLFALLFLQACGHVTAEKEINLIDKGKDQNYMMGATLYFQTAAEVKALQLQAYNVARDYLDRELLKARKDKRAIIVDADETIIDNSPYQVDNILKNQSYNSTSWEQWVEKAQAQAIPGALAFLNYAHQKGISIFYISNRKQKNHEATLKNLKNLGFPVAQNSLLLREKDNDKTKRRSLVENNYFIVMLMGDNLGDFLEVFQGKSVRERFKLTDEYAEMFGRRFIVLPNPMYGEWETILYQGVDQNNPKAIQQRRIQNLRTIDI
jgi:5'-nucleotidase (lipoprotein e(P4) family)